MSLITINIIEGLPTGNKPLGDIKMKSIQTVTGCKSPNPDWGNAMETMRDMCDFINIETLLKYFAILKLSTWVATLKRNIVAKFTNLKSKYPPSKQKLYFNGNKLGDSRTVDVIGDNGTIYLRHEDVIEVSYCTPDQSTVKIKTLVDKYETIAQVKARLLQAKGLDPTKYSVTYCANGQAAAKTLNPETLTVDASGIQEFGILHFIAGVDGG
ncbi:hypothetical protein Clacol_005963 [Clathrus columnatus]|uniref:Ubiquitin-like domain-containing protein n=1 Tax=Clathrus columnatus TaxID=1419009 RepID=A0AAV5AIF5_9AGAM|nr:hypothetical protein Clacol_005963 [Clathrus columnatus]